MRLSVVSELEWSWDRILHNGAFIFTVSDYFLHDGSVQFKAFILSSLVYGKIYTSPKRRGVKEARL